MTSVPGTPGGAGPAGPGWATAGSAGVEPRSREIIERIVQAQGQAVTIGADDDAEEILRIMSEHQVRRLPVIAGHTLVGIVAFAEVARAMPDAKVGDLLQAISQN